MLLFWLLTLTSTSVNADWIDQVKDGFSQADANVKKVASDLESFKQQMNVLARQVMLQQFYAESRVRTDGGSGLKALRARHMGLQNYHSESYTGHMAAAVHDHANNIRTVGMGEFAAVMNGVEFRTRHNDYRLYMPSKTSKEYGATEEIPFPAVPPSVKNKPTLAAQIEEMRAYFKAFRDEDSSIRNYEQYFKSLLCYLEGSWTHTSSNVDESFESDRHFIDAKTWQELQEKLVYTEATGAKSRFENLALLPTSIIGFYNDTIPIYAQWNFRILCHPLKKLLKPSRMRVVEDLHARIRINRKMNQHMQSRAARFQLNNKDSAEFEETLQDRTLLDELMEEIPGKDNYPANIEDEGLETTVLKFDNTKLNAGYYHRWFTLGKNDAMGQTKVKRGFQDPNLFVAATTNDKVASVKLKKCTKWWRPDTCKYITQKWSYAIPLEIVYLTPLATWNPHGIKYLGTYGRPDNAFEISMANGRTGFCSQGVGKALNGATSRSYYMTPAEFYVGGAIDRSSADTVGVGGLCFLNALGQSVRVRASGTRVLLPSIHDVGVIRTRYPIFPVHAEASAVWKELNALRDIVLDPGDYKAMYWNKSEVVPDLIKLVTMPSKVGIPHEHEIYLTKHEVKNLQAGFMISKTTTEMSGHDHVLEIRYLASRDWFIYMTCDKKRECWDKHSRLLLKHETDDTGNM